MPFLPSVSITGVMINQTRETLYGSGQQEPEDATSGYFTGPHPGLMTLSPGQTDRWKAVHGTPDLTVNLRWRIGDTGWGLGISAKNPAIGSNEASARIWWAGNGPRPAEQYACSATMPRGWDPEATFAVWPV